MYAHWKPRESWRIDTHLICKNRANLTKVLTNGGQILRILLLKIQVISVFTAETIFLNSTQMVRQGSVVILNILESLFGFMIKGNMPCVLIGQVNWSNFVKNSDAWLVAHNVSTLLASSNSLFDLMKKTVFNYKETSNFSTKHIISTTSAPWYSKQRVGDCK